MTNEPERARDAVEGAGSAPCYLHEFGHWFEGNAAGSESIRIKRVYDAPAEEDGRRYLVDRLWPRGLKREEARLDGWLKELAPSKELRRWFSHDPKKWEVFRERYLKELAALGATERELIAKLQAESRAGLVTLVFAARDMEHNQAVVLRDYLLKE